MSLTGKQDLRNIVLLIIAQAFAAGVGLIAFVRIGSLFAVNELGRFGFASSSTVLFGLLAELGIRYVAIKDIAIAPQRSRKVYRHSIALRVLLSTLTLALLYTVAEVFPPWHEETRLLMLAGLVAVTQFGAEPITWVFFGQGRVDIGALILILDRFLYIVFINLAALVWNSAESLLLAAFLANLFRSFLAWLWVRSRLRTDQEASGWDTNLFRQLIWDGMAIGVAVVVSVTYMQITTVVAQSVTSPEQLGLYAIAIGIVSVLLVIPMAMTNALFPSLARTSAGDTEQFRRLYATMVRLMLLIGVPMAVGVFLFADPLLTLWVGGRYEQAINILRLLAVGLFAATLNYLYRILLFAFNRPSVEALLDGIGIAVVVVGGSLLGDRLGAVGIAIVYVFVEVLLLAAKIIVTRQWLGAFPQVGLLIRLLIATLVPAVVMLIGLRLAFQVLGWVAGVSVLLVALNIVPLTTLRSLWTQISAGSRRILARRSPTDSTNLPV
mgnify:CR=1 FL=1